jgi:hypothetical protein
MPGELERLRDLMIRKSEALHQQTAGLTFLITRWQGEARNLAGMDPRALDPAHFARLLDKQREIRRLEEVRVRTDREYADIERAYEHEERRLIAIQGAR